MHPFAIARQGKGFVGALQRGYTISRRYGLTPTEMKNRLLRFNQVLQDFDCGATFPITAVALQRSPGFATAFRHTRIELALHGYFHADHQQLSPAALDDHFQKARRLFQANGLAFQGFRSPYLRWNAATLNALQAHGFQYDSSEGLYWEVVDGYTTESYQRVLEFYGARPAAEVPALPRGEAGLIRIPYCLPDDESLVERFRLTQAGPMQAMWLAIFEATYQSGELFALGLHPERIDHCATALRTVLAEARRRTPAVWIARLNEIAEWWRARSAAAVPIDAPAADESRLCLPDLPGLTVLARSVELLSPATHWDGVYRQVSGREVRWRSPRRPLIGVSPAAPQALRRFLTEQGYIVETAAEGAPYAFYWDRPQFTRQDERPLLAEIEQDDFPLVRLGRWPDGARSALCLTGDIDALTVWDYGLRFLGR